jgi:hypothetical protein
MEELSMQDLEKLQPIVKKLADLGDKYTVTRKNFTSVTIGGSF